MHKYTYVHHLIVKCIQNFGYSRFMHFISSKAIQLSSQIALWCVACCVGAGWPSALELLVWSSMTDHAKMWSGNCKARM